MSGILSYHVLACSHTRISAGAGEGLGIIRGVLSPLLPPHPPAHGLLVLSGVSEVCSLASVMRWSCHTCVEYIKHGFKTDNIIIICLYYLSSVNIIVQIMI